MNRNRFRGNRNQQHRHDKKVDANGADEDNPVVNCFRQYAIELSDKHDRYERIIKQSRDITIESKRLIFLMHTFDDRKPNCSKILCEAKARLESLYDTNFANIAKELHELDQYQYAKAYSAGLQEFIEACTYYDYLNNDRLLDWNDLQVKLTYAAKTSDDLTETDTKNESIVNVEEIQTEISASPESEKKITCLVQPIEFMLGLADLSGEVMRKCINSLGSGDIEACFKACNFIQNMYSGYVSLGRFSMN